MSNYLSGRTSLTTVQTANLADDAVTLAKITSGTDGELITWDASGDPSAVPVGTATHVLTSNGAGAAPTFQAAAAGGAWTLIATDVGDSSGNLEVTGLSATYDTYAIALSDVVGASDAQHGYFRLGDSGGYDSGASDYSFIAQGTIASSGSYTGDTANANQSQMKLTMVSAQSIGNATGEGIGGLFYLHTPSDGSTFPLLSGTVSYTGNGGVLGTVAFGGRRESSITVDRVTFLFQSGNVASGRMTVWGIAHA